MYDDCNLPDTDIHTLNTYDRKPLPLNNYLSSICCHPSSPSSSMAILHWCLPFISSTFIQFRFGPFFLIFFFTLEVFRTRNPKLTSHSIQMNVFERIHLPTEKIIYECERLPFRSTIMRICTGGRVFYI